jgi:hypothetical protein
MYIATKKNTHMYISMRLIPVSLQELKVNARGPVFFLTPLASWTPLHTCLLTQVKYIKQNITIYSILGGAPY